MNNKVHKKRKVLPAYERPVNIIITKNGNLPITDTTMNNIHYNIMFNDYVHDVVQELFKDVENDD